MMKSRESHSSEEKQVSHKDIAEEANQILCERADQIYNSYLKCPIDGLKVAVYNFATPYMLLLLPELREKKRQIELGHHFYSDPHMRIKCPQHAVYEGLSLVGAAAAITSLWASLDSIISQSHLEPLAILITSNALCAVGKFYHHCEQRAKERIDMLYAEQRRIDEVNLSNLLSE